MRNLSKAGRIFYGIGVAEIGLQAIYYHEFPYILSLPKNLPGSVAMILAVIFGMIFTFAGACIISERRTRQISLLFGAMLLLIFCFYYIPYEFLTSPNYMHLGDWENAAKELTLAGGAFVIAGCYPKRIEGPLTRLLAKLIPFGTILFAITMIDYGISHFVYAKEAADYIPSWIPYHLFWMYFCGVALLGSGIAIILTVWIYFYGVALLGSSITGILTIWTKLAAALLGIMIFTWFVSLHMPRVIVSPIADIGGEITSAIFALAYGGIAFVIAGAAKKIS